MLIRWSTHRKVSCFGENDDGVVDIIDEVGEDVAGDNQSETDETVARNSPRCGDCRLEVFQDITYAIRARRVGQVFKNIHKNRHFLPNQEMLTFETCDLWDICSE